MFFDDDFEKALSADKKSIIDKGTRKINYRLKRLSEVSKRELKKEIRRIKKNAINEDGSSILSSEQIKVLAEDNLLKKIAKKERLAEQREKDTQFASAYKGVFKKGSREDFPDSVVKKREYFSDSIRLAGKMHADKNIFSQKELDEVNFLLSQMFSCHGQVVAVLKNDEWNVFALEDFPAKKINPKRKSTVTLGETLLNISSIKGTDVYLRTPTFWYNEDNDFSVSKICTLYNMVIDVDDCPLSNFESRTKALRFIYEKYPFFKNFKPDAVIDTGNKGFHAIYFFDKNIVATKTGYNYIANLIGEIVGADLSKCTINGSTRMPYSVNSKGNRTRIISLNRGLGNPVMRNFDTFSKCILSYAQSLYLSYDNQILDFNAIKTIFNKSEEDTAAEINDDLKEGVLVHFYDAFKEKHGYMPTMCTRKNSKRKKDGVEQTAATLIENEFLQTIEDYSKTSKHISNPSNSLLHIVNRLHDLEEYAKRHEYNFVGCRNNFMTLYCCSLFLNGANKDNVWASIKKMNRNFGINALRESEIRATYLYATRAVNSKQYHKLRYSDFAMANMLELDEDDFLYMRNRYTVSAKKAYKEKKEEEYNEKRRNARMFIERHHDKVFTFMKALRKYGATATHHIVISAAKEVGISKATAYRYIQAFSLLNNIENENKQKVREYSNSNSFTSIVKKTVENFKLNTVQYIKNYLSLILLNAEERFRSSISVSTEDVIAYKNGLTI